MRAGYFSKASASRMDWMERGRILNYFRSRPIDEVRSSAAVNVECTCEACYPCIARKALAERKEGDA